MRSTSLTWLKMRQRPQISPRGHKKMGEGEVKHIQASFFTKEARYSVQDTSFSLPVNVTQTELTSLINQLIQGERVDDETTPSSIQFDFLINGELIRDTLETHISDRNIPTENVINIEYIQRLSPPALAEEINHDDWVSCAHCNRRFILSGCYDNGVNIWKHNGELVCVAKDQHSAPVKDVKWVTSPDSVSDDSNLLFLSCSQDQNVNLWELSANNGIHSVTLLHECKGHARSVEAIAVSPDETKFCSVSWDTFLKIWSTVPDPSSLDDIEDEGDLPSKKIKPNDPTFHCSTTRTPIVTFQGHTQPATAVEWIRHDDIITAGWDNSLRVWDVNSGEIKNTLTGSKVFHDISWSSLNGLVASGNSDRLIRIWDVRENGTSMIQSTLSSHQGWVVDVEWSPNNEHQLLSGSYDSTLKLWDIRSSKVPLYTISAHEGKVLCCDWSLAEMFVSGGSDNKLRTYSS